MTSKPHLAPELREHLDIACGLVAKMKVVTFMHFAGVQLLLKYLFSELSRSHQRKIASKGKKQDSVESAGFEQAKLFRSRRDQLQSGVRPQDAYRMRLEADCHRFGILLPRATHNFFEHMAMRAMNAVKVPDAHQRRAEAGGNFFEFVEDVHEAASSFWLLV